MDLRQLRYLVGVADNSTFSAAAERLRVAQPALTRQIHDLERELGVELFVPAARRATLTAAGEASVQVARFVVDEMDRAVNRVRLTQHGLAGKCHIGMSRVPIYEGLAGRLLDRLRENYPGIVCTVTETEFHALWSGVEQASFDIGIGVPPPPQYTTLNYETQIADVMDGAMLAADHPLARRESIRLDELRGEPYVGVEEGLHEACPLIHGELRRRNFEPAEFRRMSGTDAIIALVIARRGWGLAPRRMRSNMPLELVCVPLEDFAVPTRFARIWRRSDARPVTRTVLSLLRRLEAEERVGPSTGGQPADPHAVPSGVPPRIELRHLRNFLAVAESGSQGRAAEELGLSQPALSRQMRDLEFDLGAPLLVRETRGVELTVVGEQFRDDAREILAAVDGLKSAAHRAERGVTHRCIVAMVPLPRTREVVGQAIHECETRYSPLMITPVEMGAAHQLTALHASTIDVGIFPLASPPALLREFRRMSLFEDEVCIALVHPGHPLAARGSVSIRELETTPLLFVARDENPWFYDDAIDAFAAVNFTPRIDAAFNGLDTIWSLVAQGQGWNLASREQWASPPPGVVALQLTDFSLPFVVQLVHRHDETRPTVLAMVDAVQRCAQADVARAILGPPRPWYTEMAPKP